MIMKRNQTIWLIWCLLTPELFAKKVGLLIVATGQYIQFVEPLVNSAEKYFCVNHEVRYFVFTDAKDFNHSKVTIIEHKRLGWPLDTLQRFNVYSHNKDNYKDMDYLFAVDADMLFVAPVGDEILSDRVGTQHPGFVGRRGTYETRSSSKAYIGSHEGKMYFAGGFNGGSCNEFLKMAKTITENINEDMEKNIIAIWHDESHLNRYFVDNPPTCILNPSYCYPESWNLPYPKKLLALDKNHAKLRK